MPVIKAGMKRVAIAGSDHRPAAAAQMDTGGEGLGHRGECGIERQHLGRRTTLGRKSWPSSRLASTGGAGAGESGYTDKLVEASRPRARTAQEKSIEDRRSASHVTR